MPKNQPYNFGIHFWFEDPRMPKIKHAAAVNFGARLIELRKAAGFTQQELADEVGVSRRMIAYYEVQSEHPPTTLLPALAKALNVSTDVLLGTIPIKRTAKPRNTRLERRLKEIEKLDAKTKRQVMQLLDTFITNQKLKQKVEAKQPA
jgi:transcriptional regulator with XRE-family HTH domain